MTTFVVSLFLPNTIHFELPTGGNQRPGTKRAATRIELERQPSLFPQREFTPPKTPDAEDDLELDLDHDEFFAPKENDDLRVHFPKLNNLAPNDPHSPAWGSGRLFNQPRSRASSPPPAALTEHIKVADKALQLGRAGVRQPQLAGRSDSHDRVFAHAGWTVVPAEQGNGGLRNAVSASNRQTRDDKIWVGTVGMPTDALEDTQQKQDIEDRLATEYDSLTVFCKDGDFDGHYTHFCKQILWPVFHYQIPDNPKSKAYEDHSWVYYVKVNQAFADRIVKDWKRGDIIWIHDYHLLLVPQMVRKKLPDAKIGFFLHVAFPSSEVFRCLAVRKELLEGMLGANLIGFQVREYAKHFLQTCSRLLCVEATNDGVQLEDRFVNVIDLAIGIDPVALHMNRNDASVFDWMQIIQDRYRGKKLIVARDKLDGIRGVRQKLLAYELFLNKNPQWRERVVMIQVATSSTEQSALDATVSDIVTRVNSAWATLAYQPLVYLKQDISYPQYLALLTVADALMITSQREGMNLTSHEYIFCQDGKFHGHNRHGSLILSEFTGSASIFGKNDISVNPWYSAQCADAIGKALDMGDEEKSLRWQNLHNVVTQQTAGKWYKAFIDKLNEVYEEHDRRATTSVPRLSINNIGRMYRDSERRLFIVDYEGTLASWGSPTNIILTSPQRTIDVLNDLLMDDRNVVYVMSSRTPEELDSIFKSVPNIGLIAENGCFLKAFQTTKWTQQADLKKMRAWKKSVQGIMKYYQERTPGSWIDEKHCSIVFNYKECEDKESASRQAGDCASHINDACEEQRVRAIPVDGAVVVEPIDFSKATAATQIFHILDMATPPRDPWKSPIDFLLVIGDGRDDEVIFRWANELGKDGVVANVTTCSLGSRNTEAGCTLTQGVTGVLTVLQKLAMID